MHADVPHFFVRKTVCRVLTVDPKIVATNPIVLMTFRLPLQSFSGGSSTVNARDLVQALFQVAFDIARVYQCTIQLSGLFAFDRNDHSRITADRSLTFSGSLVLTCTRNMNHPQN